MSTKRFSTFEGVFTPCLLSILGVIMYLRLGWVIGSVGLGLGLVIIMVANVITLLTALSMSSVVTNIRIGAGGAYSMITKSLGIEAGGAIGLPLFISQAISVAFYITGFSECWKSVFPQASMLVVSLSAWFILMIISYFSTKLAFRVQYVIMAFIGLSIVSLLFGKTIDPQPLVFFSEKTAGNFWPVFAVFFPAVTGILAGASMSGELKEPGVSIPRGTLLAIGISLVIYTVLAVCFSVRVSPAELQQNFSIALDMGRWRGSVVFGIMGATLSSALAMFVGAPRVLLALARHRNIPFPGALSFVNKKGEPTAAVLVTAVVSFATILLGSLDQIASLLTMFFLITYGMINFTVFMEQSMGIASFRPSFRVPKFMPFLGACGCVAVMFLINVEFSLVAFGIIGLAYFILMKKGSRVYSPDIRSGMLTFLAEKLARMANALPYYPKIWKPNLLIYVLNPETLSLLIPFLEAIVLPEGRVIAYKIIPPQGNPEEEHEEAIEKKRDNLSGLLDEMKEHNLFIETTVVESDEFAESSRIMMQTLKHLFFPPNTFFFALESAADKDCLSEEIVETAGREGYGIMVLDYDQTIGFSQQQIINLWIRESSPNMNLSILISLQLERNWEGRVRIIQVVNTEYDKPGAYEYLEKLRNLMRMPADVELTVLTGSFQDALESAPSADINIFGMPQRPDIAMIRNVKARVRTSVLFLRDSKHESALA